MNNCCICWFFTHILLGILIFKGLTERRLYKSFGVKVLIVNFVRSSKLTNKHVHNFVILRRRPLSFNKF
jgi:hypothetical protein